MSKQIEKLLDRNAAIYQNHIDDLTETQARLLDHMLGKQPSSASMPSIQQITAAAEQPKPNELKGED